MQEISLLVWILAVTLVLVGSILPRHLDNRLPCFMGVLFGAGGLVCAFDEYDAGTISEPVSMVLIVAMLIVMVWGLYLILAKYLKGNVRI